MEFAAIKRYEANFFWRNLTPPLLPLSSTISTGPAGAPRLGQEMDPSYDPQRDP